MLALLLLGGKNFMRIRAIIIIILFSVSYSYASTPWTYGEYDNATDEHNIAFAAAVLDDIKYTIGSQEQEVEFAFIRAAIERKTPYMDLNFRIILLDADYQRLVFKGEYTISVKTSDNQVWNTSVEGWGSEYLFIPSEERFLLRDQLINSESLIVTITKDNLKIAFSLVGDNFSEAEKQVFAANKPRLFNTWFKDTKDNNRLFIEDIKNPNRFMEIVPFIDFHKTISYMISFYESLDNGYYISAPNLDWGNVIAYRFSAGNEFFVSTLETQDSLSSLFFRDTDLDGIRRILLSPETKKLEFYLEPKQILVFLIEDAEAYRAIDSDLQERLK